MSATWAKLTMFLRKQGDVVELSWQELDDIVGGMPPSSIAHAAWWAGDRPQVRAWRAAGFEVAQRRPGVFVRFRRVRPRHSDPVALAGPRSTATAAVLGASEALSGRVTDVLLLTCVKQKAAEPAPACDLYTSPTFRKSRRYAEERGVPWFILSAEYGLVAPREWLSPYERYLPDTPPSYRRAWGEWVAARLELLVGPLRGKVLEVHACEAYVAAATPALRARGAELLLPLEGLRQGERSAWYDDQLSRTDGGPPAASTTASASAQSDEDPHRWAEQLSDASSALSPSALDPLSSALRQPGLYSWWVDAAGAADLSRGLGHRIEPGLVYAGQAGATRWPSGRRSGNTLAARLVGMHLGRKAEFSTFRRTLGSALGVERGWQEIDEPGLTAWMHAHLRVLALPHPDGDSLGDLEEKVLQLLDPPLNLRGMASNTVRSRLKELRKVSEAKDEGGDALGPVSAASENDLPRLFHRRMVSLYEQAKAQAGYNATYFLRMLSENGGVETARRLVMASSPSEGFTHLYLQHRLDLTVEAAVLEPEFAPLFDEEVLERARRRLDDYGHWLDS